MHTRWEKRKNERERLERKEEKRKETAGGWMENKREREMERQRDRTQAPAFKIACSIENHSRNFSHLPSTTSKSYQFTIDYIRNFMIQSLLCVCIHHSGTKPTVRKPWKGYTISKL